MRSLLILAVAGVASVFSGGALADPAYTAKNVVDHFVGTRGICVGTATECEPESYDLLITFDLDSDALTQQARENLGEFAKALANPMLVEAAFEVDGHTDARGTEDYNVGLSERRARSVIDYLAQQGVDAKRLIARGFGKSKPRTDDPFDPVNRRVEARLVAQ